MWFIFAIYGLFIFMFNWKEEYSEPCKTSYVELSAFCFLLFAKLQAKSR